MRVVSRLVVVCALGYFVDIYDLILFSIVRVPSLRDIGVADGDLVSVGAWLLSWQMGGMLLGGLLWGVLGDRRGRRSILFGSIALYSLANLANAFVDTVGAYATLRFLAGVGLAGELGAAVTLVSEALPAGSRAWGTSIVSAVGILGAVAGYLVATLVDWRAAYVAGGVMGLGLLVARFSIHESALFRASRHARGRGDLRLFLGSIRADGSMAWWRGHGSRLRRLVATTLVGVPIWCAIGILVTFSPEVGSSLGIDGIDAGAAVVACYGGASLGSLASGALSQWMRSRRVAVLSFVTLLAGAGGGFLLLGGASPAAFYALTGILGLGIGYWAVFAQLGAEQFGTDLRATVATAVPNLVRGSVVLLAPLYTLLEPSLGAAPAAVLLLAVTSAGAHVGAWSLAESHGRDLDFAESGRLPAWLERPRARRPRAARGPAPGNAPPGGPAQSP